MLPPEKRKDITHLVMNANAQEWPKVRRTACDQARHYPHIILQVASQLLAVMAEANPAKYVLWTAQMSPRKKETYLFKDLSHSLWPT